MIYVRGQPEDFDHWGQLGNRGWSWDDVLPYFKRPRTGRSGADEFHGKGGPLLTSRTSDKPALCEKIIEAGIEIGLEYREDVNHLPPGVGRTASAGCSRPGAAGAARARRAPICARR